MTNFGVRPPRVGLLPRLATFLLVLTVAGAAYAQLTSTVQLTTTGDGEHEGRCEPFTGCNNIDTWQTLFKRDPLFAAQPTLAINAVAFHSFEDSFSSATFSHVRITLGTRTADTLGTNFANNLSNAQIVYDGALTLASVAGSIAITLQNEYEYSPGLDGNLVLWWQNLGGEGKGDISQFVDFEGDPDGEWITAYFAPSNANGNIASTANVADANRLIATGPVTTFTATFDPTNLTNIYAPAGGPFILNTELIKKSATLTASGTFSVQACLALDNRFDARRNRFNAKVQPWSGLVGVAGSCDFLLTSPLRFPKWVRATEAGTYNDVRGHYIAITHSDTAALTLESVIVTDQSDLVTELFGVVYDTSPGACSDANIHRRPIAVGGEATAPANTDVRPTYWQCNFLRSGTRGTDIAEGVVQTETSNDDTYVVQQMKNELDSLVNVAAACVSNTTNALQEIATIQSRQQELHNAFAQENFELAYRLAENIAYHNESIDDLSFALCDSATQNLRGAITALSITMAMSIWDRHYTDGYECYIPKTRSDEGVLEVFAGFENTCQ